jgi:hypothetical protein
MQEAFCIVFLSTAQKYFCIQMEISNGYSFPMQSGFFGSAVLRDTIKILTAVPLGLHVSQCWSCFFGKLPRIQILTQ